MKIGSNHDALCLLEQLFHHLQVPAIAKCKAATSIVVHEKMCLEHESLA